MTPLLSRCVTVAFAGARASHAESSSAADAAIDIQATRSRDVQAPREKFDEH